MYLDCPPTELDKAHPREARVSMSAQLFRLKYASWLSRLNEYFAVRNEQCDQLNYAEGEVRAQMAEVLIAQFVQQIKASHRAARRALKTRFRRRWFLRTLFPVAMHYLFLKRCRSEQWIHPHERLLELRERFRNQPDPDYQRQRPYVSNFEVGCRMEAYFKGAYNLNFPRAAIDQPECNYHSSSDNYLEEHLKLRDLLELAQSRAADYRFDLPVKLATAAERLPRQLEDIRQQVIAGDARLVELQETLDLPRLADMVTCHTPRLAEIDARYPEPVLPTLTTETSPQILP